MKTGNHPLIQEYNTLLDTIENEYKARKESLEKKIRETQPTAPPHVRYKVIGIVPFGTTERDAPDVLRFVLALVNKEEIVAYSEMWGCPLSLGGEGIKDQINSRGYRYISDTIKSEGQIVVSGGGMDFLQGRKKNGSFSTFDESNTIPCTDEEWDSLLAGEIPSRMRPDWLVSE